MIRAAQVGDVPFMLAVARERYPPFDDVEAKAWAHGAIANPDMAALRSANGFLIASLAQPFWGGPLRCYMHFLCVRRSPGLSARSFREGLALVRAADHWRQTRGAQSFHFGEETGANYAPLARSLGATQDSPSYTLGGSPLSFAAQMFKRAPNENAGPQRVRSALDQVLGVR